MIATCVSAIGLLIFPFQTESFSYLFKDLRKWVLISGFAFAASFGSWSLLGLASRHEGNFASYSLWLSGETLCTLSSGFLVYFLYKEYGKKHNESADQFLEVRVKVLKGRNLVGKDVNLFGQSKTSDPYVKLFHANTYVGGTTVVRKTVNPIWNDELFCLKVLPKTLSSCDELEFNIFDRDKYSSDDAMGTVMVPIPKELNTKVCKWYKVGKGGRQKCCQDPTGDLQVEVEVFKPHTSLSNKRESTLDSPPGDVSTHSKNSEDDSMPGRQTRQLEPIDKPILEDVPTHSKNTDDSVPADMIVPTHSKKRFSQLIKKLFRLFWTPRRKKRKRTLAVNTKRKKQ